MVMVMVMVAMLVVRNTNAKRRARHAVDGST